MKRAIIFGLVFILLASSVLGLGISPSRNEVYYSSGEIREVSFRIINNEHKDANIRLIARGELADYVDFEKELVEIRTDEPEKIITYTMNMPRKLEPGVHTVEIVAVESGYGNDEILVANVGVVHKLHVRVPYPDQYLEGILYISEARPNEEVTFTATVSNVGSDDIEKIQGSLLITGPSNEGVARLSTDEISLAKERKSKVEAKWIANVNPGTYHVQAIIEYDNGKVLVLEKDFDVGEPLIDIEDVRVASFKLGTIAKFDIAIANKWNQKMPDVYGITDISDSTGVPVDSYKTSSADIPAEGTKEFNAYWDTTGIEAGEFIISVKAHYLGRIKEKVYEMEVKENEIILTSPSFTGQVISNNEQPGKLNTTVIIIVVVGIFIVVLAQMIMKYMGSGAPKKKQAAAKEPPRNEYPELRKYIKKRLGQGYSRDAVRKSLEEKGWNRNVIDYEMIKAEESE